MVKEVNEYNTMICNYRCNFEDRKCNSKQSNGITECECKSKIKNHVYKEDYVWNPSICASKCEMNCNIHEYAENNKKYLLSNYLR